MCHNISSLSSITNHCLTAQLTRFHCCLQVHGDVFRPPTNASLLSVYVGTGMQLIGMGVVTMVFAVLGFLSPANRGGLMTAMLLLFVFMGVFGGYYSARLYKLFKVYYYTVMITIACVDPAVVTAHAQ